MIYIYVLSLIRVRVMKRSFCYFSIKTYVGFPTRSYRNHPAQLHWLARKEKFSLVISVEVIFSNKRITKVLIRLRGCAGWSAHLLLANPRRQGFWHLGPNVCWMYSKESPQWGVLLSTYNKCSKWWVRKYLQIFYSLFCLTWLMVLLDFSPTVKTAPHECVIRTSQP